MSPAAVEHVGWAGVGAPLRVTASHSIGFYVCGRRFRDGWIRRWEVASVSTVGRELFSSWFDVHGVTGGEGSWW